MVSGELGLNDKVQGYLALFRRHADRFHETQQLEQKGTLAAWAMLVAAVYASLQRNLNLGPAAYLALAVPAIHFWWLKMVQESLNYDKQLFAQYRENALALLESRETHSPEPISATAWHHVALRVVVSLLFAFLFVVLAK